MRKLKTIEIQRLSLEQYREAEKLPVIVVLDDVRSMLNVGSIFRTADAFRLEAIYLCGITATPPSVEIHKTALGAEETVAWKYFETADEAVAQLKNDGFTVYSVEQAEGATMLNDFITDSNSKPTPEQSIHKNTATNNSELNKPIAIVMGNEVKGVKQSVIDASDSCLEIPQYGTKHSMNVAVAAGIVMWEIAKHYRNRQQ